MSGLALAVAGVFGVLAGFHVYWLFGGKAAGSAAIPEVDGRPAFEPGALATIGVTLALSGCAVLTLALGGWVVFPLPEPWTTGLGYAMATAFFLRAIGEFRLVGFFKRVRGTRFARWDTWLFSPLCLALALAVFFLARG